MAKKLRGNFFFLTANNLRTGQVVYYTKTGWSSEIKKALKIKRDEIELYQSIGERFEKKCVIISPFFVELNDSGKIRTTRDLIRLTGITFKL